MFAYVQLQVLQNPQNILEDRFLATLFRGQRASLPDAGEYPQGLLHTRLQLVKVLLGNLCCFLGQALECPPDNLIGPTLYVLPLIFAPPSVK